MLPTASLIRVSLHGIPTNDKEIVTNKHSQRIRRPLLSATSRHYASQRHTRQKGLGANSNVCQTHCHSVYTVGLYFKALPFISLRIIPGVRDLISLVPPIIVLCRAANLQFNISTLASGRYSLIE
jgi:hypothetical protein